MSVLRPLLKVRLSWRVLLLRTLVVMAGCYATRRVGRRRGRRRRTRGCGRPRGNRRDGHASRGEHQSSTDQHHRHQPGRDRPERHQGLLGHRPLHARGGLRLQPDQPDLDSRHLLERRIGHHRNLHRRYADSGAQPGLQLRRHAGQALRPRPRRSAARSAGNAVRRRLGGRHGALHHGAAQPHQNEHLRQGRNVLHRGRHAQLRIRRGRRYSGHRRRVRRARQRLVPARRRLDRPHRSDHAWQWWTRTRTRTVRRCCESPDSGNPTMRSA